LAVVDYVQPEVVTTLIPIAAKIAVVLHQHKGRVVLTDLLDFAVARIVGVRDVLEIRDLDHVAHNERATAAGVHCRNLLLPLRVETRGSQTSTIEELVDELRIANRVWISLQKGSTLHPLISERLSIRLQI